MIVFTWAVCILSAANCISHLWDFWKEESPRTVTLEAHQQFMCMGVDIIFLAWAVYLLAK